MGRIGQKLLSPDLKIRVVETYQKEGLSFGKIAEKFSIGKSTAYDIVQKVAKHYIYEICTMGLCSSGFHRTNSIGSMESVNF